VGEVFFARKTIRGGEQMAGKNELINSIAESGEGLTRRQATAALDAVFDAIVDALRGGDTVRVPGFGGFSVSERGARKGRNPATGESINIKASKSVRFKPGKELKEAINKKRRGGGR
jgi:DNA-binding protein HU-beta